MFPDYIPMLHDESMVGIGLPIIVTLKTDLLQVEEMTNLEGTEGSDVGITPHPFSQAVLVIPQHEYPPALWAQSPDFRQLIGGEVKVFLQPKTTFWIFVV